MNKTLISRLVIGALATLAAGSVMAGQLQASSTSIAREAIVSDAQQIISPTVAYRFFGDVDPTVNTQVFQVQLTLDSTAEWDTTVVPTDDSFVLNDGITGLPTANPYTIVAKGFSTDKKTLWVTVSATGPNAIIKQPIFTYNGAGGTTKAAVVKLKTVVGDLPTDYAAGICKDTKSLIVNVKHFVALATPGSIADGTTNGVADEHTRATSTNAGTILVFPTNLLPVVTTATAGASLAPGGNFTFAYAGGAPGPVAAVVGGLSNSSYTGLWNDAVGTTNNIANLGTVQIKQNATGYDADTAAPTTYLLGKTAPNAMQVVATSAARVGNVEALKVTVDVAATNGFVKGGSLQLYAAPAAAGAGIAPTPACTGAPIAASKVVIDDSNKAAASIQLVLSAQADINAAFGATGLNVAQVCYTAPGGVAIPASQFTAVARVVKAPNGTAPLFTNEQDNICNGGLYSLGGGLKIDVRNYASSKETSGYQSVIRLINNSDAREADVWGQIIHQNGQFGGYGKLATLKPREIRNMPASEVDSLLINAPTATASTDNGASVPAASGVGAPRLRITSQTGASLRVQNYLFNSATGQILEASNAQAVDFEGTLNRAPGSDGQYISQDANSGLNGK